MKKEIPYATTIKVRSDTRDLLDKKKVIPRETYDSVICRLVAKSLKKKNLRTK